MRTKSNYLVYSQFDKIIFVWKVFADPNRKRRGSEYSRSASWWQVISILSFLKHFKFELYMIIYVSLVFF